MVYHIIDDHSMQSCLSAGVRTALERMDVEIAGGSIKTLQTGGEKQCYMRCEWRWHRRKNFGM